MKPCCYILLIDCAICKHYSKKLETLLFIFYILFIYYFYYTLYLKSQSDTIKQACFVDFFMERVGMASSIVLQFFFHRNVLNCSGCGAFFDRKIPQRVCVPGRSDVWTKCPGGWKAGVHKNNGRSRKGRVVVPCSRIREGTCGWIDPYCSSILHTKKNFIHNSD